MPVVSVIIPVFNCEATLEKAVISACAQTLRDIEIVIVDDCSTDGSFALAQKLAAGDARITCKQLAENGGSSVARNEAIDMATGEWIAVLDADDWYLPTRLEVLLRAAQELKADLICDNLKIFDHVRQRVVDETSYTRDKPVELTPEYIFYNDTPLKRHAIGYTKPMVTKAFLTKHHIRNDPAHRAGQDFIFLADIILNGARAFLIRDALYVYVHRISPTTRKISPTSRSDAGFVLIVRGCDELMERYGATMTPKARRALKRKRWIFANRVKCSGMLMALHEKKLGEATKILAAYPFIMVLIGVTVAKMAYANLLLYREKVGFRAFEQR